MKIVHVICALGAALGMAHGADQSSKVETEGIKAFIRKRMQENDKWGWFKSKPSAGNQRPEGRELVICSVWCPSGYTRRDVTIGKSCSWYHIGKCVDRTAYEGESCGFAARTCNTNNANLVCEQATDEEMSRNAHFQACHIAK